MKIDPPASWRDPALRRLIDALTANGGAARLVGGCVRDAILGLPAQDLDVATPLRPEAVKRALEVAGVKVVPTGLDHGTFTAVADHHVFEVTSLRRDVSTDGRRAIVEFTEDWAEDAARRDLTFNALFADLDGRVHDHVGGVGDLRAGLVRFVGDPAQRIIEDYLRIPRYFRFFARFAKAPPSAETMAAMRENIAGVDQLSGERIKGELFALLNLASPLPGVDLAAEVGYWSRLWPPPADRGALARLIERETSQELPPSPVRRLAALAGAGVTQDLADRLRLSRAEAKRLLAIPAAIATIDGVVPMASQTQRRALGATAARDAALIAGREEDVAAWMRATSAEVPAMPVTAKDLIAKGAQPGPEIGRRLLALQQWWDAEEGRPDRTACLAQDASSR